MTQPRIEYWDNTSDHTSLMYKMREVALRLERLRTSKTMLNNVKNIEEAGELYRQVIPKLIGLVKTADIAPTQAVFDEVA